MHIQFVRRAWKQSFNSTKLSECSFFIGNGSSYIAKGGLNVALVQKINFFNYTGLK